MGLYLHLQVAGHRVRAVADGVAKDDLGVTAAQLGMLRVIEDAPGCTQRDVAQALRIRESGVTAAIAKLDGLGLVRRERRDGRSLALWLTERGRELTAAGRPLIARLESQLAEGFTAAELAVVERFLHTAIDRFREIP